MRHVLLVTFFVMVLVPTAWAQAPFVPSFDLGVGGGINKPLGDSDDTVNNGYNLNLSVGYNVVPMFTLGAEFGLFGNGGSDETIAALGSGGDVSVTSQQFTAMGKLKLPMALHALYAKGLMGAYRVSANVKSSLGDVSVADTNFGFGIGGGFQFKGANNAALYVEGIYHRINADDGDGEFATFNVGGLFSF